MRLTFWPLLTLWCVGDGWDYYSAQAYNPDRRVTAPMTPLGPADNLAGVCITQSWTVSDLSRRVADTQLKKRKCGSDECTVALYVVFLSKLSLIRSQ